MSAQCEDGVYFVRSSDNKFLTVVDNALLTFASEQSINARFKIIDAGHGCFRIKCIGNNKYWKLNRLTHLILADGEDLLPGNDTLFHSMDDSHCKVFQSVANNKFCNSPSINDAVKNVLMATATSMDDAVKLKVVGVLNAN